MAHVLLLEPDRVISNTIVKELSRRGLTVSVATNADTAIELSDEKRPDVLVCELSIPGHSGSEFIYEFRTYTDWKNIPIIIFSSLKPATEITNSKDWKLLDIQDLLYKPDTTLQKLGQSIESASIK
jgi:DNA-binding response OmpR family regulator